MNDNSRKTINGFQSFLRPSYSVRIMFDYCLCSYLFVKLPSTVSFRLAKFKKEK